MFLNLLLLLPLLEVEILVDFDDFVVDHTALIFELIAVIVVSNLDLLLIVFDPFDVCFCFYFLPVHLPLS